MLENNYSNSSQVEGVSPAQPSCTDIVAQPKFADIQDVRNYIILGLVGPLNTSIVVSDDYKAAVKLGLEPFWPLITSRILSNNVNAILGFNEKSNDYLNQLQVCIDFREGLGLKNPQVIKTESDLTNFTANNLSIRYDVAVPTGGTTNDKMMDKKILTNNNNNNNNISRLFRDSVFTANERRGLLVETGREIQDNNSRFKREYYRILKVLGVSSEFIQKVDELAKKACAISEIGESEPYKLLKQIKRMANNKVKRENIVDPDEPLVFGKGGQTASGFGVFKFSLNDLKDINNGSELLTNISNQMSSESRAGQTVTPEEFKTEFLDNEFRRIILQESYDGVGGREVSMTTSQLSTDDLRGLKNKNLNHSSPVVDLFSTDNLTVDGIHVGNLLRPGNTAKTFDGTKVEGYYSEFVAMQGLFGYLADRISGSVKSAKDYFVNQQTPYRAIDYRFDKDGYPVALDVNAGRYNGNVYHWIDYVSKSLENDKGLEKSVNVSILHNNYKCINITPEQLLEKGFAQKLGNYLKGKGIMEIGTPLGVAHLAIEGGIYIPLYVVCDNESELNDKKTSVDKILNSTTYRDIMFYNLQTL